MVQAYLGGEGAGPGCTAISPPRTMNFTNDRCAGASAPMAATGALFSGSHHCRALKCAETQLSTCWYVTKQTIYCWGRRLSKKEDEKERLVFSSLFFDSSLEDATTET